VRSPILTAAIALAVALGAGTPGRGDRTGPPEGVVGATRLEALVINGGGTAAGNYQSHLLHVRELVDVLRRAGVPDRRITILSGDGPDPEADVALREMQPEEGFWLVTGTRLERSFETPVTHENSSVDRFTLRAATRVEVSRWFATTGARLRGGDTLLLYVTDHGTKNARDTRDNRITLWGKGESLSVGQLRGHLARLDPGVRVVMLMSQCYSGSFANLAWRGVAELPAGNACGYFSTSAERPSYGCYPENRGVENIGHSFDFLQELATSGSFRNAHLRVLREDVTPDVPLRTSDFYLEELLRRKGAERGRDYTSFVDALLAQAWKDKGAWEPEIRLLDAIGHTFGTFSPRSLAELEEQASRLPEVAEQLRTHGKAWKAALGDANRANLERFLEKRPRWAEQVSDEKMKPLGPGGARDLAGLFLLELAEHTRADPWTDSRLGTLRGKAETAGTAAYRMEVRLGVVLRMRTILATIAGRVYLGQPGTARERAAYETVLECETLSLPLRGPAPGLRAAERSPFPPLEEDLELAKEVLPAWLGIRFREATPKLRAAHKLAKGAASVIAVYPDSPAEEAGLEVGDVITGPPGSPFQDPQQIREWTMLARIDRPAPVEVLRGDERIEVMLVPRAYPLKWPELPGPPRVSSIAPALRPLRLTAYRGSLPDDLRGRRPHLLFFWATWCGPCKAALPELLAFEGERQTPVLAITDEPVEKLDSFFRDLGKPFPERVATDEERRAFLAYGVSGSPTFVLVDGEGVIRSYSTGYSAGKSLGIEGWKWAGRPSAPGPGGR